MSYSDDPDHQPLFKTDNGSVVDAYEGRRYTGRSQGFLDRRERASLEQLLSKRAAAPGQTVLDMPCGYGRIAPILVGLGLTPLWGDISFAMAKRVSRRPEAESGVGQLVGSAEQIPLATNAVDGATCIRLIEHFRLGQRRTDVMRELGRVVRRWLVVSFYDGASIHGKTKRLACKLRGKEVAVAMQSRASFRAEADAAGLDVVTFHAPARFVHAHTFALLAPRE
jgi:SAM-dependent methyltransferase